MLFVLNLVVSYSVKAYLSSMHGLGEAVTKEANTTDDSEGLRISAILVSKRLCKIAKYANLQLNFSYPGSMVLEGARNP